MSFLPILVTPDEYYLIGFLFILIGVLHMMYQASKVTDENEEE